MEFEPVEGANYLFNYEAIARDISESPKENRAETERQVYRDLVRQDLWFLVYFVLKIPIANHPFVVNSCREVQEGAKTNTLDVWAREHFKSTIITVAESIQDILNDPSITICILSYNRATAISFLKNIKQVLEGSDFLQYLFPEILYENTNDAVTWSLEGGLFVKRPGYRKEGTIEAWGLIDGQPTGRHFDKVVYDDVVTDEVARSPDMIAKVKRAFDMSANVGTDGGRRRVIGTFYHHNDPLVYIQGLTDLVTEEVLFDARIKPASDNGLANGNPVFISESRFAELRSGDRYIFNCQQLCNPTPITDMPLSPKSLIWAPKEDIPRRLFKFMVIDPAGLSTKTTSRGDAWAIVVGGVDPVRDDIGASSLYILDMIVEPMNEAEAVRNIQDIYMRNGRILQVGVEKAGQSTAEIHVRNALLSNGVNLSIKNNNLKILHPGGRQKETRIERNLSWPLVNGKIHINDSIPSVYKERLVLEMEKFPSWHDDILDCLSYFYDIMKDYVFPAEPPPDEDEENTVDKWMEAYMKRYNEVGGSKSWMIM